jgi:preprotein translocase subunit SecF
MIELFSGIKVDWIGKRQLFFAISIVLLVIGMISLIQKGRFQYGVDFRGGTTMKVHFNDPVPNVEKIREALEKGGAPQPDSGVEGRFRQFPGKFSRSNTARQRSVMRPPHRDVKS